MYRARTHYTILDDLPTFGRAHHLPTFRVMIDSALTALGCLLCALGAVLDGIGRRFDRAGAVLIGEIDPTSVNPPLIQWEGGTYSDHDTEVSLHLDPMADTEVSPALVERPVLADAMSSTVAPVASESFPTQIPALSEIVQQTRSRKPARPLPFALVTYIVRQRVSGNRWEEVGTFEGLADDLHRREGLRRFLESNGIDPKPEVLRKYSARKASKEAACGQLAARPGTVPTTTTR